MKTFKFKLWIAAILLACSIIILGSCNKNKDDDMIQEDPTYFLSGNASGSQEVPAVSVAGTASIYGDYNARTNVLNYIIEWVNLTDVTTGVHFHGPATAGVNAAVLHTLNITTNGVSGRASGSLVVAEDTEQDFINGRVYYNIHTTMHPAGEIRGKLILTSTK